MTRPLRKLLAALATRLGLSPPPPIRHTRVEVPAQWPSPANDDFHDSRALFAEFEAESRALQQLSTDTAERIRRLHAAEIDRSRPVPRAAE